jgi:hypothetical protein
MTMPRNIRPGTTWMITRRVTRRHFLLRPDKDGTLQRIYWYVTAVIAAKFGIQLHAVQVLSTHLHEILTDPRGLLPAFVRERNRLLANAVKCHRGWPEEVFQRAPASYVELHGPDAIASKIGYTLANCVEAGLVHNPRDWPGVTVQVDDIGGRVVEAERPDVYFDPENPCWPERAQIEITMPDPIVMTYGERARAVLRAAVAAAIARARELARAAGRFVTGPTSRLFSVSFTKRSRSYEPFGGRNPSFAVSGNREYAARAVAERRSFLQQYRAALDALRRGVRDIVFPEGAWRWSRELLPRVDQPLPLNGTAPPACDRGSRPRRISMSVGSHPVNR